MTPSETLLTEFKNKNIRALSRLISLAEEGDIGVCKILSKLYDPSSKVKVIGITGAVGAGKSTLVNYLIRYFREKEESLAVLAVDPVSQFTGGALLGDRIRLSDHFNDPMVFIRSLSTRGKLGGLSLATREGVHLCTTYGFDSVIVETVGVGQTEIDIRKLADVTLVILTPESGDTIQTMKAGILEIADIFVVNKADREGADKISAELRALCQITGRQTAPIFVTTIRDEKSIRELFQSVVQFFTKNSEQVVASRTTGAQFAVKELLEEYVRKETSNWLKTKIAPVNNPYEFILRFQKRHPLGTLFSK